jgi:hypothetical protein
MTQATRLRSRITSAIAIVFNMPVSPRVRGGCARIVQADRPVRKQRHFGLALPEYFVTEVAE